VTPKISEMWHIGYSVNNIFKMSKAMNFPLVQSFGLTILIRLVYRLMYSKKGMADSCHVATENLEQAPCFNCYHIQRLEATALWRSTNVLLLLLLLLLFFFELSFGAKLRPDHSHKAGV